MKIAPSAFIRYRTEIDVWENSASALSPACEGCGYATPKRRHPIREFDIQPRRQPILHRRDRFLPFQASVGNAPACRTLLPDLQRVRARLYGLVIQTYQARMNIQITDG